MTEDEEYYFHQTPVELCKKLIDITPLEDGDKVLEPFRGEGGFYNNLPEIVSKDWCEIRLGRDYKDYEQEYDWVVSNPPFKLDGKCAFWKVLKYYTEHARKGIALLGNEYCLSSLTVKRLKELNNDSWFIHRVICCSIKKWKGRYYYIIMRRQPCEFYGFIEGNY